MASALVIGGTGPSGSTVVEGLLERDFAVTILHRGLHEVALPDSVRHIHADPHFRDTIEQALNTLDFDVTICMYGRTRLFADLLRGRTGRFIMVTGSFYEGWIDGAVFSRPDVEGHAPPPRQVHYAMGPRPVREDSPLEVRSRFAERVVGTETAVLAAHDAHDFSATIVRYPQVYGPRQPAPLEWSLIRRARDGRHQLLLPDGGLSLQSRLYSLNAAKVILGAVDYPDAADGQAFNAADAETLTHREWVALVGDCLGHTFEIVPVRYDDAIPCYAYALNSWNAGHRVSSIDKAVALLDYRPTAIDVAMRETVSWYQEHPLEPGSDEEQRLADPFDYAFEDAIITALQETSTAIRSFPRRSARYVHSYDHPTERS